MNEMLKKIDNIILLIIVVLSLIILNEHNLLSFILVINLIFYAFVIKFLFTMINDGEDSQYIALKKNIKNIILKKFALLFLMVGYPFSEILLCTKGFLILTFFITLIFISILSYFAYLFSDTFEFRFSTILRRVFFITLILVYAYSYFYYFPENTQFGLGVISIISLINFMLAA